MSHLMAVCAWCKPSRILRMPVWPGHNLVVRLDEDGAIADAWWWHSEPRVNVIISHGICEECKAVHFPSVGPTPVEEAPIQRSNNA